ncbi:hypothetical protein T01_3578 [Trichinella spiralis]|uniref:Uncharacterized protein n=1 Tax=Trichinella spiralis TaxID=6334 RepID=A0A0V1ALI7_TRISP|nr:hypothetical protein T01_3578 [Trichinella spiralis]
MIKRSQSFYPTPPISKPAMMQLKRYLQLKKQRKKRIDEPFEEDSHVKNGASTSGQLAEQKQIKKWMALKTTDTKRKAPAMGRAGGPEDLPLNLQQFITLNITLHSDEPP